MKTRKDEITFRTNFFSNKKAIHFTEAYIGLYIDQEVIAKFETNDIEAFRFGVRWIHGFEFTIGRLYCIDIRSSSNKKMKIRLRSLYGMNKKKLNEKFRLIIEHLYRYYFDEKISGCINSIENGEELELAGVIFRNEGIYLDSRKKNNLITWEDLHTRAYSYYYTMASFKDPAYYRAFTYLTDWNAGMIYAISRQLLSNKGLFKD